MQARSSIKPGDFDVGMSCSREEVTQSVRGSSAIVTNVVSSSSFRMMRLDRLFGVDTAKTSVPHGQQAGRRRVRIKCMKKRNEEVVDGCVAPLLGSLR